MQSTGYLQTLAIEWWGELPLPTQRKLVSQVFPDKDFILVKTSPSMIQEMMVEMDSIREKYEQIKNNLPE